MYKVTPNPPETLGVQSEKLKLQQAAERAFGHCEQHSKPAASPPSSEKLFSVRPGLSTEAALSNASEMLESATACAYDCAEHLDGSGRKQVLAVVQMIEIAQLLVNEALKRECPVA